jgi:ParB/RepB/Spo0J family partition protein
MPRRTISSLITPVSAEELASIRALANPSESHPMPDVQRIVPLSSLDRQRTESLSPAPAAPAAPTASSLFASTAHPEVPRTAKHQIVRILLSTIQVDPLWNSRCRSAVLAEGEEDPNTGMGSNGIKGLVASIRAGGQSTPVDVIANVDRFGVLNEEKPFFLIAGFRRVEALSRIAKEDEDPVPAIDAIVRDLTPVGARLLNLRENTARDDLRGADLAYGVALLVKAAPKMSGVAIAAELNKSTSHISKILKMNAKVKPELIKHWRDTPGNPVTVTNMFELSNLEDQAAQEKTYYELFKGTLSRGSGEKEKTSDWKVAAKKRAGKIGTLLGNLSREYGLDCECLGDFETCLVDMVKLPADVKGKDVRTFAKAAHAAYLAAIEYSPAAEREPDEEKYDGPTGREEDDE